MIKQFSNECSASQSDTLVELTDSLTFLEIFLINKDYVAGDTLTIADISLLANVTHLEVTVEFDLSSYPNIWGWFNRLRRELPYYDQLTKLALAEHREYIRNIRNAQAEYSAVQFCPCEDQNESTQIDQAPNVQTYEGVKKENTYEDQTYNGLNYYR